MQRERFLVFVEFQHFFDCLSPGGNVDNEVAAIPCYNTNFKKPAANNHPEMTACTSTVVVESVVDTPPHKSHDTFDIRGTQLPTTSTNSRPENVNVEVNETLTPEHNESSDSLNAGHIVDINEDITCEDSDKEVAGTDKR